MRRSTGQQAAASGAGGPDGRSRTVRAVVSGMVQGVGFRWSCLQEASSLGLVGSVSNLDDGTVEVLAQGPSDDVSRLIAWLYRGPGWARVDGVLVEERAPGSLTGSAFEVAR
ncbi:MULTISPECIES: acylphosphatase [unclassified Actinomyces]|uniref:acylphosphatase n=1 Tax=unclassified Actinomyces TaxID=2609248 RepID=UPI002016C8DF|nr:MULTISPECIES: acylphosphatase [unclassified Actinomyces]MCL3777684.1 acylphosphatase [Actinomyces sp. AC-20-1]MCL3789788.1 acylphosphatase [Actinomyces sp. 187325]MCL3791982.1 acylphosphatase [Actinomyces sp. 186855]MCL3794645.1 acylphosphatase [Actinomyces sp. 217892]